MDHKVLITLIIAVAAVLIATLLVIFEFGITNFLSTGTANNYQNTSVSSNSIRCQSVIIGTGGSGNTGGSCSGYSVIIGTGGTYTNYGNACPSQVIIGSSGVYYNNVTGCNPKVIVGSNAKYYNTNR